jgi:hypothetical protein
MFHEETLAVRPSYRLIAANLVNPILARESSDS